MTRKTFTTQAGTMHQMTPPNHTSTLLTPILFTLYFRICTYSRSKTFLTLWNYHACCTPGLWELALAWGGNRHFCMHCCYDTYKDSVPSLGYTVTRYCLLSSIQTVVNIAIWTGSSSSRRDLSISSGASQWRHRGRTRSLLRTPRPSAGAPPPVWRQCLAWPILLHHLEIILTFFSLSLPPSTSLASPSFRLHL